MFMQKLAAKYVTAHTGSGMQMPQMPIMSTEDKTSVPNWQRRSLQPYGKSGCAITTVVGGGSLAPDISTQEFRETPWLQNGAR